VAAVVAAYRKAVSGTHMPGVCRGFAATRGYRTWYAAAVKQGMIADSVSLEKIIGSIRP
jgi:hypothetical protein